MEAKASKSFGKHDTAAKIKIANSEGFLVCN